MLTLALIIIGKRAESNSVTGDNFKWQSIQNTKTVTAINAFRDTQIKLLSLQMWYNEVA